MQLGTRGGWEDLLPSGKKGKAAAAVKEEPSAKATDRKDRNAAGAKARATGAKRKTKAGEKSADDSSDLSEPDEVKARSKQEVDDLATPTRARRSKRNRR